MSTVPSIETPRGRTEITSRAMTRLVTAVAAEALGVQAGEVTVDLTEADGSLDIAVRLPPGEQPADASGTAAGDDDPAGTEQTREQIRRTVTELTGSPIHEVSIRRSKTRLRLPRLGN